jgi:hypothetical protein
MRALRLPLGAGDDVTRLLLSVGETGRPKPITLIKSLLVQISARASVFEIGLVDKAHPSVCGICISRSARDMRSARDSSRFLCMRFVSIPPTPWVKRQFQTGHETIEKSRIPFSSGAAPLRCTAQQIYTKEHHDPLVLMAKSTTCQNQ